MTRSPRRLREQVKDTVSELPVHAARLAVMGVGRALMLTDRVRKDYHDMRESGLGPVLGRLRNDAGNITGMVVGKVSGNGRSQEEAAARAAESEISVGKPKPAAPAQRPATPPTRPAATRPTTPKPATKPAAKPAEKPAAAKAPAEKPAAKPKEAKPAAKAEKPAAKPAAKPATKATTQAAKKTGAKATTKATAKGKPSADLPVTGYDEASLASVRARLRNLDAKQVTELRDYERSHAARADFLRMYENRLAKLRGDR